MLSLGEHPVEAEGDDAHGNSHDPFDISWFNKDGHWKETSGDQTSDRMATDVEYAVFRLGGRIW